jgi:hypothetical protein
MRTKEVDRRRRERQQLSDRLYSVGHDSSSSDQKENEQDRPHRDGHGRSITFERTRGRVGTSCAITTEAIPANTAPHLKIGDLGIGYDSLRSDPAASTENATETRDERQWSDDPRPAHPRSTARHCDETGRHAEHDESRNDEKKSNTSGERRNGRQPPSFDVRFGHRIDEAFGESAAMTSHGRRNDHDPRTGEVSSPTQIERLAVESMARFETFESPEEVGSDQETGRRQSELVARRVVLFLIEFEGFESVVEFAETVDVETHRRQKGRLVPVHQFGSEDPGIGPKHLLDELSNAVRSQDHVVVKDQEESSITLHQSENLIGGPGESDVPHTPHVDSGHDAFGSGSMLGDHGVVGRGHEDDHLE